MATEKECEEALELYEKVLSKRRNVIGLGIVPLEEGEGEEDLAVAVYVEKKVPESKLAPGDRIPRTLEVRKKRRKRKVPTRVIEQGPVSLEQRPSGREGY